MMKNAEAFTTVITPYFSDGGALCMKERVHYEEAFEFRFA